jgi:hypothetical protein
MAYFIGGTSGEANAFEKTIQNSAIQVLHESQGLVNMTNVVMPNQGNTYKVPHMAPVSYGDYTDSGVNPTYNTASNSIEQTASITAKEVVATPAVAQTAFSKFLGWTTAFDLAANLGTELGLSFAEKVDQRVASAFVGNPSAVSSGDTSSAGFANTQTVTYYTVANSPVTDGFARVQAMAAQSLLAAGSTATINSTNLTSNTVTGLVRNIIRAWREARNPGRPTVILSPTEEQRLLGELTGGAVYAPGSQAGTTSINAGLTALGDELLATGMLRNLYGCTVIFSTFLQSSVSNRFIDTVNSTASHVGAAIGPQALTTVMVKGLDISMGDKDGGLQTWITGLGYFGSGVTSQARGLAINIA